MIRSNSTVDFVIKVLSPVVNVILVVVLGEVHGVDVLQDVGVVHADHLVHSCRVADPHTAPIGWPRKVTEVSVGRSVGRRLVKAVRHHVLTLEPLIRLVKHNRLALVVALDLLVLVVVAGGAGAAALHVPDLWLLVVVGPAPGHSDQGHQGDGQEAARHHGDDDLAGEDGLGDSEDDPLLWVAVFILHPEKILSRVLHRDLIKFKIRHGAVIPSICLNIRLVQNELTEPPGDDGGRVGAELHPEVQSLPLGEEDVTGVLLPQLRGASDLHADRLTEHLTRLTGHCVRGSAEKLPAVAVADILQHEVASVTDLGWPQPQVPGGRPL